jgi:hypothetical protein
MVGRGQQREVTNETSLIETGQWPNWREEIREIKAALGRSDRRFSAVDPSGADNTPLGAAQLSGLTRDDGIAATEKTIASGLSTWKAVR